MAPVIRRSRRNNALIVALLVALVVLWVSSGDKGGDAAATKSIWTQIKDIFKDDEGYVYKSMENAGLAKKFEDIDFSDLFVSSDAQNSGREGSGAANSEDLEKQTVRFTPKYERANATFYTILKLSELSDLLNTIHSVEERFNHKYHYDWVFVSHKAINSVSKKLLANSVSGNAIFYKIPAQHWGMPGGIDRTRASAQRRRSRLNGIKTGIADLLRYRARYQAGFFYNAKALQKYKYYMKVDPGIEIKCDVHEDFFSQMALEGKKYGFVNARKEAPRAVESLWDGAKEFAEENKLSLSTHAMSRFFVNDDSEDFGYNLCYISNYLEVFDLDVLRSDAYKRLFDFLDAKHGWFYERWTDSHIHSLAALLLMDPATDLKFLSIPHKTAEYETCFQAEDAYFENNCYCDPAVDQSFDPDNSCLSNLISALKNLDPILKAIADEKKYRDLGAKDQDGVKLISKEDMTALAAQVENEDGSLYNKGEDARLALKAQEDPDADEPEEEQSDV